MAKSWATVVRGFEAPAPAPVSKLNPLAVAWKPREIHHCVDCGQLAQMCENGCDRPGNRSIVPRLGRNRWGKPLSVCARCHYDHERAISQLPYMDMGPLPDSDREGKLPFLCNHCASERSYKEFLEHEAKYQARKAKDEQMQREVDAYMAKLPKMSSDQRSEHFRIAYAAAREKVYGPLNVAAAGGGAA